MTKDSGAGGSAGGARRKATLWDKKRPGFGQQALWAELRPDGRLLISGQDLGSGVEQAWGGGLREYEWGWSVESSDVPAAVALLGGEPGEDPLAVLVRWTRSHDGADPGSAVKKAGIPVGFWNRVGD